MENTFTAGQAGRGTRGAKRAGRGALKKENDMSGLFPHVNDAGDVGGGEASSGPARVSTAKNQSLNWPPRG